MASLCAVVNLGNKNPLVVDLTSNAADAPVMDASPITKDPAIDDVPAPAVIAPLVFTFVILVLPN